MRSRPPPRNVQKLVEDQVRRWRLDKQEREGGPDQPELWPLVTVSREHGSLGSAVAKHAADRLDFSFWDQEIVQLIALQTGAQEALVESLDERTRSALEDFVSEVLMGIESSVAEYVRQVARIVRTFDRHGSAVVVGRGAQFILDPAASFRVRVVCPYEVRVERIAELHKLSHRDAEREVRKVARDRQEFIRRHYQRDIGAPVHYDLVVNTGDVTIESAADIVAAAYRVKYPEPRRIPRSEPPPKSAPRLSLPTG